jgi:hypothetical protein
MAFKPNYNRDRAERDRAARARSAEKQQRKEEKSAQRRALREGVPAADAESAAKDDGATEAEKDR